MARMAWARGRHLLCHGHLLGVLLLRSRCRGQGLHLCKEVDRDCHAVMALSSLELRYEVRNGAVRCGAVRCGAAVCGAVRYGAVWCGAERIGLGRFGAVHCGVVRWGATWLG